MKFDGAEKAMAGASEMKMDYNGEMAIASIGVQQATSDNESDQPGVTGMVNQ